MRVISGLARSIRLHAPPGRACRPTEDRVKETLFSILGDMRGHRVLDLFAGTGALGLEALSRQADSVMWVERERRHIACIKENLEAVRHAMGDACGETRILCCDVRHLSRTLSEARGTVSRVLADPPYHAEDGEYGASELIMDKEFAEWLAPGCILALEHGSDVILPWSDAENWEVLRTRSIGIRTLTFARRISK